MCRSEADSPSADEGILRLLWNPKVHHRGYKSPALDPSVGQLNLVHTTCLFMIHFNIILPSAAKSSKWSLPFVLHD
jgi:hypothetical protein